MARPVTLAQLETMMRRLGWTDIRYVPGAQNADRPGVFDPIGVTVHITAGGLGSRSEESYIRDIINGDPGVPLKSNQVGAPDGTCWMNAAGNTNHCLHYGPKVIPAILGPGFSMSGSQNLRGSLTKWSPRAYGMELIAASKPNNIQRQMAVIWAAALCILHGWSAGVVHGHGEVAYDRGFGDPNLDMGLFRRDVQTVISRYRRGDTAKPGTTKPTTPRPTPPLTDVPGTPIPEDDMTITRAIIPAKTGAKLPLTLNPNVWTALPAGENGWTTILGNASKALHLIGSTDLRIEYPSDAFLLTRFFAWDKTGKRVAVWPEEAESRVWEISRQLSTLLNPGHRLGIEVKPSARATLLRCRSEFNILTNR